jgi:hypothetical protein
MVLAVGYYVTMGSHPSGTASLKRRLDVTGVRADLLAIVQAERIHMATHGKYGTLEELALSGALRFPAGGRRGYAYSSEVEARRFRITARPRDPADADGPTLSIDETGQISQQ